MTEAIAYQRPELLAEQPNEVWSWDITKLLGPATWTYFYLYVILDVYSRYAVAWTVQQRENSDALGPLPAYIGGAAWSSSIESREELGP